MNWRSAYCFGADVWEKGSFFLGATYFLTISAKDSSSMDMDRLECTLFHKM
jgi:hypothetical protein